MKQTYDQLPRCLLSYKRAKLVLQIAEGGYSYVYLAQEVATLGNGAESTQYAVKKVPLIPVLALCLVLRQ